MSIRIEKQEAQKLFFKLLDLIAKGFGPIEIYDKRKKKIIAYLLHPNQT